jgi:Arc-like DNA binding domain
MARKRDDTVKLVLRLPPELHRRLTRVAVRKNQSLNSEMIQRLEESFARGARDLKMLRILRGAGVTEMNEKIDAGVTEMNEKMDRVIAALEAQETEDEGEKK